MVALRSGTRSPVGPRTRVADTAEPACAAVAVLGWGRRVNRSSAPAPARRRVQGVAAVMKGP